jgi:sulfite exporter TauE/SafE
MIFIGGLLGSSHCVGMCGGFALALGTGSRGILANLWRQLIYGLGRVFTYAVGGAVVGYGGWRLTAELAPVVNVQATLCIVAGLVLIVQGMLAAGVFRGRKSAGAPSCLAPSLFGSLLSTTRMHNLLLGGMINGLLPCGLVYAYLALAASAGDLWRGAGTMILFGLGTLPVLTLVGLGGTVLSLKLRHRILVVAAWCVVLTGMLSVARGLGFLQWPGLFEPLGCPCSHSCCGS